MPRHANFLRRILIKLIWYYCSKGVLVKEGQEIRTSQVVRRHFLERRGEGIGIILNEGEELNGIPPVYELFDEELRLTIFATHESPHYSSK